MSPGVFWCWWLAVSQRDRPRCYNHCGGIHGYLPIHIQHQANHGHRLEPLDSRIRQLRVMKTGSIVEQELVSDRLASRFVVSQNQRTADNLILLFLMQGLTGMSPLVCWGYCNALRKTRRTLAEN